MSSKQPGSKDDFSSIPRKRFKKQDVIKMGPQAKVPFVKDNLDEPPNEKQLSEAEIQLKNMVHKQLDTNINLEGELARKKKFLPAAIFKDEQQDRAGTQTLEAFKQHTMQERKLEELRDCGLTDEEIRMGIGHTLKGTKLLKEPMKRNVKESELAAKRAESCITQKIQSHDDSLKSEASFSNAREMTRHELEIEQSLYRGTKKADELKHLVKAKTQEFPEDDPVMKTLKEYEDRERRKRESLNKTLSCQNRNRDDDDHDDDDDSSEEEHENRFVGPILAPLHVRVKPLDEAEVRRNKLNVDEIKSIAKFSNYEPGKPNKRLYIKNLPRSVSKEDLAQLFVRFESMECPNMEYKVLAGRMKGQAFVTFQDPETAEHALNFANGFIMKGKPIIISFGRETKS